MRTINHFVGGQDVAGKSGRFGDVFNPATGEVQAKVALASTAEVDAAVEAAHGRLPGLGRDPAAAAARASCSASRSCIEANIDALAADRSPREHGKVLSRRARARCTRGLEVVEFACGIPHLLKGEFTENVGTGVDS